MEEFRIIKGFEFYSVSNLGRIRREVPGVNAKVGSIKNPQVNKTTGYSHVKVRGLDGKRSMAIHRLVAEAFIPNPDGLREIDHIDRDKQNNQVSNLRWCTRRENMANIEGKKGLVPILAYPPDGGDPLRFECLRDAAKCIAELIGENYWPQGISNVLNNPKYTHYKKWRFEKLPAEFN
jgi:hypothetical protein